MDTSITESTALRARSTILEKFRALSHLARCSAMAQENKTPVLVVEDEMFIRMVAVDALEETGFSIVEAGDADEALKVLERTPGIALIFTDINMPGSLDGMDLAADVARRWPHVEIIVTSGGVHLNSADIPDAGTFLPKPYSTQRLIDMVKEHLAR